MNVLVTGAAGLIGSAIANQLHAQGHTVVAVDNYSRGTSKPNCAKLVNIDLQDFAADTDYDIIYHMAAVNGTTNFYEQPNHVLENNFTCDMAAIAIAKKQHHLQKFVYASTSELVAGAKSWPTPETSSVSFDNVHDARWSYSLPKLAIENLLVNGDLPWLIIRYFNVYGNDSKPGHFVHDQITKIKQDIYELVGASETRSYCYIDDAVDATIKIAELATHDIVNVGNDTELTSIEAAEIIAQQLERNNCHWKLLPGRSGSAKRRCPGLNKLRTYIPDYKPCDFRTGIKQILDINTQ